MNRYLAGLTAALALSALAVVPAQASTTVTAGVFGPSLTDNVTGMTLTQQAPLNIAGYSTELTLSAPLARGGRYAATTDMAVGRGLQLGIGAGIGKLKTDGTAGFIVSPFASLHIAPKTSVVARYYTGGDPARVGSTTFVGLQYTL